MIGDKNDWHTARIFTATINECMTGKNITKSQNLENISLLKGKVYYLSLEFGIRGHPQNIFNRLNTYINMPLQKKKNTFIIMSVKILLRNRKT